MSGRSDGSSGSDSSGRSGGGGSARRSAAEYELVRLNDDQHISSIASEQANNISHGSVGNEDDVEDDDNGDAVNGVPPAMDDVSGDEDDRQIARV